MLGKILIRSTGGSIYRLRCPVSVPGGRQLPRRVRDVDLDGLSTAGQHVRHARMQVIVAEGASLAERSGSR
jgi:hypothetical protein